MNFISQISTESAGFREVGNYSESDRERCSLHERGNELVPAVEDEASPRHEPPDGESNCPADSSRVQAEMVKVLPLGVVGHLSSGWCSVVSHR